MSLSGYLIGSQEANKAPLKPAAEHLWWYQYYFATERGAVGYKTSYYEFNKLIWEAASPTWKFSEYTYNRSAASFNNQDHVSIVIDNYRWRLGLSKGEARYNELEVRLAKFPVITVPTVTLEGDANGAPHPDPNNYAVKYKGQYVHDIGINDQTRFFAKFTVCFTSRNVCFAHRFVESKVFRWNLGPRDNTFRHK